MFKELYKQLSKFDLILIVTGFFIDTFMKLFNILILMLVLSYKDVINREDAYKYGILCILVYVLLSYLGYIIKNRNILKFSSRRDLYFKTFLNRCMSMPYSFFEDGNIMAKAKEVNSFVASYYTGFEKAYKSLVDMGSNGFFILLVLILSIFVDGTVFISFIFVMIIQVITLFIIDKYKKKHRKERSKIEFKVSNYTLFATHLTKAKDIRMYSADKMYEFYQDNIKNKYLKFLSGYYKLENLGSFIISIVTALGFSFILYRLKDLTLDLIMIIGSSFLFVGVSISSIVKNYISYSEENYNYHIFDMFMEESKSKIEESAFLNFKNSIEFKNVDFIYPGTDKLVLKNLSFKIDKGDHIALLGINGSGKTTIIKLLLGFYRPTRGSILIDGIDMANYSYNEISKMFAPMFQNVEPLALTIAEVVSAKEKSEQNINKIYEALKQVGLYDIVLSLEKNIDTPLTKILDSDGYVFSGGGNQKLAMARVIYNSERPIVILDEPTAALDSISEEKFYMELDSIIKNRTAIFITHRLASINFLDKIMVLNNGKIEEMGTHAELMEKNGIYKEMYDEQAYHYKFEGEL